MLPQRRLLVVMQVAFLSQYQCPEIIQIVAYRNPQLLKKGDTAALPVFLMNDKNRTDLNFSPFLCELGLKMLGPQQWQLLHVEKEIQHNNNKTWETKEKSIRKAFLFKTLVKKKTSQNCSSEIYLFWFRY
jgi:hypothetical protein